MNKKSLFISVTVVIVLLFTAALILYKNDQTELNNALVTKNINALERPGAPFKGSKDAKVSIVEFFDPACGTCSQFFPLLNKLIKKYPGKIKVIMRYAPLHEGSDQVVKMLEAAHLQDQFWPALELLFANQQHWVINHVSQPDSAQIGLMTLDLDQTQFNSDWNSDKVVKIIQRDVKDSQTLKVQATPEFFVNGKPMPSFGYKQLVQLVEDAIAEEY